MNYRWCFFLRESSVDGKMDIWIMVYELFLVLEMNNYVFFFNFVCNVCN